MNLNSPLFVTKKVQRRTLASVTYPNALLPSSALALRAPPPVTVAFATPLPLFMLRSQPAPLPGRAVQCKVRSLGGARPATLGLSRPFQAVMCGGAARASCWLLGGLASSKGNPHSPHLVRPLCSIR